MSLARYRRCLWGVIWREALRFAQQRERFFAALVRPLIWLFIFAAGFRSVLGVSIIPPYDTYITYEVYVLPGLVGMIQLFNGMQSSLSMVYDREMGSMRVLLVSPLPRWYLLVCKLLAGVFVSLIQVYAFLAIARIYGIDLPPVGYVAVLPALVLTGLMLGSIGLLLSSVIKQLENFAGVMNFVIFPMFFASSALYPLWRLQGTRRGSRARPRPCRQARRRNGVRSSTFEGGRGAGWCCGAFARRSTLRSLEGNAPRPLGGL